MWDSPSLLFPAASPKENFQFSLWDSNLSASPTLSLLSMSLSILFVRFLSPCSLWMSFPWIILSILFVRFPLWLSYLRGLETSFNSLCEILDSPHRLDSGGLHGLSILFVRFVGFASLYTTAETFPNFQFSLWDSWDVEAEFTCFFDAFNSLCEILSRFPAVEERSAACPFNSLCEILYRCRTLTTMEKEDFQFSLWDSGFAGVYFVLSTSYSFQFSLWDSGYINPIKEVKIIWDFQFSLWDSLPSTACHQSWWMSDNMRLSILFVRFCRWWCKW